MSTAGDGRTRMKNPMHDTMTGDQEQDVAAYKSDDQSSSDSDDETTDLSLTHDEISIMLSQAKMVDPTGTFRKRWDFLQMGLLFLVATVVPYRIGFSDDAKTWSVAFIMDGFVDAYFLADVFLNFRTAYYDAQGEIQFEKGVVAKNYAKTWLAIDVMGCLPVNYVLLIVDDDEGTYTKEGRSNKFFRILRLFRLFKLLRLLRINRLLRRYEEEFYALQSSFRMVKILLIVGIISHWLGCMWYYFGNTAVNLSEVRPNGDPVVPWVLREFGGAAQHTGMISRYVTSIYWSIMTMTTVGYGDISAQTFTEQAVSVVSMLLGGFVFGLIIGSLTDLQRQSDVGGKMKTKLIGHLSAYLSDRRVPAATTKRVRRFFSVQWNLRTAFSRNEYDDYFVKLPVTLRDELARELGYITSANGPGLLSQVPSLMGLDNLSLCLIASRMELQEFEQKAQDAPEKIIFRQGAPGHAMAVIVDGFARLEKSADGKFGEEVVARTKLVPANFVDEHLALLPARKEGYYRRRSLIADNGGCTVAFLTADKLTSLRLQRPAVDHHLEPFVQRAVQQAARRRNKRVFDELETTGTGVVEREGFDRAVASRSKHGTTAERFFYHLVHDKDVSESELAGLFDTILKSVRARTDLEKLQQPRAPTAGIERGPFLAWWSGHQPKKFTRSFASEAQLESLVDAVAKRHHALSDQLDTVVTMLDRALGSK